MFASEVDRNLNDRAVMAEPVHECSYRVSDAGGRVFRVTALAEPRDAIWVGWLHFASETDGTTLETAEETTQASKEDVAYWASGLEPVYLDGALRRAIRVS